MLEYIIWAVMRAAIFAHILIIQVHGYDPTVVVAQVDAASDHFVLDTSDPSFGCGNETSVHAWARMPESIPSGRACVSAAGLFDRMDLVYNVRHVVTQLGIACQQILHGLYAVPQDQCPLTLPYAIFACQQCCLEHKVCQDEFFEFPDDFAGRVVQGTNHMMHLHRDAVSAPSFPTATAEIMWNMQKFRRAARDEHPLPQFTTLGKPVHHDFGVSSLPPPVVKLPRTAERLEELAKKWRYYSTDYADGLQFKCMGGDFHCKQPGGHCYAPSFGQEIFAAPTSEYVKRTGHMRVLELGVCAGHSMAMWSEFLGRGSYFVGVDINRTFFDISWPIISKRFGDRNATAKVQLLHGDFLTHDMAATLSRLGPFDLIIDDGSHSRRMIERAFEEFFSSNILAFGGNYVITDTRQMLNDQNGMEFFWQLARAADNNGISMHGEEAMNWMLSTTADVESAFVESVTFRRNAVFFRKRQQLKCIVTHRPHVSHI